MKTLPLHLAPACLILLSAASLSALSTHTWVSANGNDANTGTAQSPFADFATAVANTAAGGTVSVAGPGDYGPVTITQSITIDGTGGGSINFAGDGEGIYIDASANVNIVLRNLTIDGGGTGIDAIWIASAEVTDIVNVVIDGCLLGGFSNYGVAVGSNSPMYVTVRNTTIQGGSVGVRTIQGNPTTTVFDHVSVDHVTVQGATSAGVFNRNGNMDISNSNIAGSLGTSADGIEADTNATLNVQSSMITSNTIGVCVYSGSTAILGTSSIVVDNGTNNGSCGGAVQGMAGAGPSPKL